MSQAEILAECVERAEAGQHVLYLRNTVIEAQAAFRALVCDARDERFEMGLLHSRFPFYRRQELESFWLARLGKERVDDGKGSVLIATQVVEQSVDIDLDFIVTDLAPADMLLQRMGRLWRHDRPDRRAAEPEFWINAPDLAPDSSARDLTAAFGKSARVYAPYVLLRTAEVFAGRTSLVLPDEIRGVLEATYAERTAAEEPEGWEEIRLALEKDRETQASLAESATKVFGQQSQKDAEGLLTRRKGAPTRDVILLRGCELIAPGSWRITPLDGKPFTVSGYQWNLEVARALYRHLVRAPRYSVPSQTAPPWLSLQVHSDAVWALKQDDGNCVFSEANQISELAYSPVLGLYTKEAQPKHLLPEENDDEFDC